MFQMQNGYMYKRRLHLKIIQNIVLKQGFPLKYLSLLERLWRQRMSCNVLSNIAGFHDAISVINVQNFYQTVQ